MIKLVLSDMDNTILPVGSLTVPQRTIDAIHACQEQGIDVGPCTGRALAELARQFGGDASCYNTSVTNNGMRVYLAGTKIYDLPLGREALGRVCHTVCSYPGALVVTYWDDRPPLWVGATREEVGDMFIQAQMEDGRRVNELPAEDPMKAGIIFMGPEEEFAVARERLAAACPEFDFLRTIPHWCDVIPRGVGKADGISVLRRALKLHWSEICVFGDADNDLDMLRTVPNAVCVANGNERAHAAARWHIGSCTDGAVASALFDIAEAARTGATPAFMCEKNRNPRRLDEDGLPVS